MKAAEWALAQYVSPANGRVRAGILTAGVLRALPPRLDGGDMMSLLRDWRATSDTLRLIGSTIVLEDLPLVPDATPCAPLTFPNKVLGSGANYTDHADEMGATPPRPDGRAFFFSKPPTTTVVGPGAPVAVASDSCVDWEVELAVVVGEGGRNIPRTEALARVAGYTVAIDLSARGDFPNPDGAGPMFAFDWLAHKGQDGFCPLGPGIVPSWQVPDPHNLALGLDLNGVTMQESTTARMIVRIEDLVAQASRWTRLEPGDVILTGTPAGVGAAHDQFLKPGDVVRAWIAGVGELTTPLVEDISTSETTGDEAM